MICSSFRSIRSRRRLGEAIRPLACARARTHDFNVPKNDDHATPARAPTSGRRIQVRQAQGVHGRACSRWRRSPAASGSSSTPARSSPGARRCGPPPARPGDPDHTFYFHIDDGHVIDANVGGNAARWINHACAPNCEADEVDGRVFIQALRDIEPGEELFYDYGLVIDERYTPKLKKQFACRCGTRGCRGTCSRPSGAADRACPGPQRASTEGRAPAALGATLLRARLEPLLPGSPSRSSGPAGSTNTVLARTGTPRRRGGGGRCRALVAERQTSGRGRLGRSWPSDAVASLTFSLALAFEPADWSGLSLASAGACRRGAATAASARPRIRAQVAQRPVAPSTPVPAAAQGTQARRPDRDRRRGRRGRRDRRRPERRPLPPSPRPAARRADRLPQEPRLDAPAALGRGGAAGAAPSWTSNARASAPASAPLRLDVLRDQAITTGDPGAPSGVARGVDAPAAVCAETA